MRQLTTLNAPPDQVLAVYQDVARWAEWRPGLQRIEIVERSGSRLTASLTQRVSGRAQSLSLAIELREDGFRERQISGWLKKWSADWRIRPAVEGAGTLVSMDASFEMGVLGLLISRRRVQETMRRMFRETAESAQRRVLALAPAEGAAEREPMAGRIRIYRTTEGLEVWLNGRRYLAVPVD